MTFDARALRMFRTLAGGRFQSQSEMLAYLKRELIGAARDRGQPTPQGVVIDVEGFEVPTAPGQADEEGAPSRPYAVIGGAR